MDKDNKVTIKMSKKLWELTSKQKEQGIKFGLWCSSLKEEFQNLRKVYVSSMIFWANDEFCWKQLEGYCECLEEYRYSFADNVVPAFNEEYIYVVPNCIRGIFEFKLPNTICVYPIALAISCENFAGYEHEKELGTFRTNIYYPYGKVTRIRFCNV